VNSNQKIKAGIVGAGGISEFHIKGLRRLPYVDIVGVADVNEPRARELRSDSPCRALSPRSRRCLKQVRTWSMS